MPRILLIAAAFLAGMLNVPRGIHAQGQIDLRGVPADLRPFVADCDYVARELLPYIDDDAWKQIRGIVGTALDACTAVKSISIQRARPQGLYPSYADPPPRRTN